MTESESITQTRDHLRRARRQNLRIGYVPTMGALHQGHAALIRACRDACHYTVVSIFVNPTQFAPSEDLANYPRPREADQDLCRELGTDLLFRPTAAEMHPRAELLTVRPSSLTDTLCGPFRPGHFEAVCTVVAKLFNIVQPDLAFFGQKDAQQAVILRRMVADLHFPIRLVVCPTVRDAHGLAVSSRNQYLSPPQRQQAACLYRALQKAQQMIRAGQCRSSDITGAMRELIHAADPPDLPRPQIDYVQIVDPHSLAPLDSVTAPSLVALAVHIGPARLIDNLLIDAPGASPSARVGH